MTPAKTIVFGPTHWHVPLYVDRIAARHNVVGLFDPDASAAAVFADAWDAPIYSSWQELLSAHPDAELAYVFVSHDSMREVCLALIEAGIPLVMEKPGGISIAELNDVERAAERADVPIAVPLVQRGGPVEQWLNRAGEAIYESAQFIAGPPERYLTNGSPWMVRPERAGGGCMINLAPHFIDLFLRSSGAESVTVSAALSSALHSGDVEDFAALTLTTPDDRVGTIQVGYAFPGSPLKRHCAFMRIGAAGTATIWSDGRASFTAVDGTTESQTLDVDSDPLYGPFVDEVADRLPSGFAGLPGIRDLRATMAVVWDAYTYAGRGGTDVST